MNKLTEIFYINIEYIFFIVIVIYSTLTGIDFNDFHATLGIIGCYFGLVLESL